MGDLLKILTAYLVLVYSLCLVIFLILTLILLFITIIITTITIILTNLSTAAQAKDGSPGNPKHTVHWSTLASQQTLFIINIIIIIFIKQGYLCLHLQALWCQLKLGCFTITNWKLSFCPFADFDGLATTNKSGQKWWQLKIRVLGNCYHQQQTHFHNNLEAMRTRIKQMLSWYIVIIFSLKLCLWNTSL